MKLPHYAVALANDSKIYECQINQYSVDFSKAAGIVKQSLSNKNVLGLGNLSENSWKIKYRGGQVMEVKPKGYAKLEQGAEIDFGGVVGTIY